MSMKSYRELVVWQRGIELTIMIYSVIKCFPNEEKYSIASQMCRAAVSIPANIAEGFGRYSPAEFSRFLRISLGSVYELQTHLDIVLQLGYVTESEYLKVTDITTQIEKMINSLLVKCMSKK